jgi:hypothetical protein
MSHGNKPEKGRKYLHTKGLGKMVAGAFCHLISRPVGKKENQRKD